MKLFSHRVLFGTRFYVLDLPKALISSLFFTPCKAARPLAAPSNQTPQP
jgi:hypothetical protein